MEAAWYEKLPEHQVRCRLCPHGCRIAPGRRGRCRARENRNGTLVSLNYARATATAFDPVEKKPLYHFFPGRTIFSVGLWGCNFQCRFCQNHPISQGEGMTEELLPAAAARFAVDRDSVGLACTYNEPFVGWEYLRDAGKATRAAGGKFVLVTNGFVNPEPLAELLPFVDAMNIDIKAFHDDFYRETCGGSLAPVLKTAETAAPRCHVEITTLLIPGRNDEPKELDELSAWIADHCGPETPAHLSAYFPRYQMTEPPTSEAALRHAREIFRKHLRHVYLGNLHGAEGADTVCASCGNTVIARRGYATDTSGMNADGTCASCGADNGIVNG